MRLWMLQLAALLAGFCLDLILGDPQCPIHPVRGIGALITGLERLLRWIFPRSRRGELAAGVLLVLLVIAVPTGLTVLALVGARHLSHALAFVLSTFLCYQMLATRSLRDESTEVYLALKTGDIEKARYAVSMIVGRDTAVLDGEGITRAAVETVAENTSDGVIAPLFYMAIGGAPLGMLYKAVNTMDSMVGYRNERYQYFGRAAAKLDDALNFLPSRLAGGLMCLSAVACGFDGREALRIFRRDRLNHSSPNSAHTESACAGALGLQLGGDAVYGGRLVSKPAMGDRRRAAEPMDILRANRLMYGTAFFALVLLCAVPLLMIITFGAPPLH